MARKYNFSIRLVTPRVTNGTREIEEFQVEGCDSFDEAIKVVEQAVYERRLGWQQEQQSIPANAGGLVPSPESTAGIPVAASVMVQPTVGKPTP